MLNQEYYKEVPNSCSVFEVPVVKVEPDVITIDDDDDNDGEQSFSVAVPVKYFLECCSSHFVFRTKLLLQNVAS